MILSGLNIPDNGKRVYKEDWTKHFDCTESEIVNRDLDLLGEGVHSGGDFSAGSIPGSFIISKTIAYNHLGQRIEIPEQNIIPPEGESIFIIRHKFTSELSEPDFSLSSREFRINSFEVAFVQSISNGDIPICRLKKFGFTVQFLEDLRVFRGIQPGNITNNSVSNSKLAEDIKIGSIGNIAGKILSRFSVNEAKDLVKALNYLLAIIDEQDTAESQARTSAISGLQNNFSSHSNNISNPHQVRLSQLIDLDAASRKISNLQAGYNSNDAVNKSQLDSKSDSGHNHDGKYQPAGSYATLNSSNKVIQRVDYSNIDNTPDSLPPTSHSHIITDTPFISIGQASGFNSSFLDLVFNSSNCTVSGGHIFIQRIGNIFSCSGLFLINKTATECRIILKTSYLQNLINSHYSFWGGYGVASASILNSQDQRGWVDANIPTFEGKPVIFIIDAANGDAKVYYSFNGNLS